MSEFCLKCFNKYNRSQLRRMDVKLGEGLCEGCGEFTKVIYRIRLSGEIKLTISELKTCADAEKED